ncbi:hypothetical protein BJY52DRAFT_409748 [Lactarius psammicola]|nr:hypothetical protein BJY52DRAFT_409748 [Lactarius psammicola]
MPNTSDARWRCICHSILLALSTRSIFHVCNCFRATASCNSHSHILHEVQLRITAPRRCHLQKMCLLHYKTLPRSPRVHTLLGLHLSTVKVITSYQF